MFFSVTIDLIQLLGVFPKQESTQSDVENIHKSISSLRGSCWFVVRTNFEDPHDNHWSIGYCDSSTTVRIETLEFVSRISKRLFPEHSFHFYSNLNSLEDDIWNHLFPLYNHSINHPVSDHLIIVIEDILLKSPRFAQCQYYTVNELCKSRRCCFIVSKPGNIVLVTPDESACYSCGRTAGILDNVTVNEKTVYAFMKADIVQFLQSMEGSHHYRILSDVSCCGDVGRGDREEFTTTRRRSNNDVLSPPTLEKYNNGSCKRNRNGSDSFN